MSDTLEVFGTEYTGVEGFKATDDNGQTKTYIRPTGTINIDDSGNWNVTFASVAVVPAGTEGTPTATKGAVVNNAIIITPSVTNVMGFIAGGTKTGTGVQVTASELVSGTAYIDEPGEWNVTNVAKAMVAEGTAGTPSASKGSVSNHSIQITPSVTNVTGFINGGTKTGTPVTVTASELIDFITYYTGTTDPPASLGNVGDIYLKVAST